MQKILAVIPARGGSKSIPSKNIKKLGGIPLITYSITSGLEAKLVNRVIVSTDDEEIADIARKCGAEVPFIRPGEIAGDETPDLPVFQHAFKQLKEKENFIPDLVVQLRPTSPFRAPESIDGAIELLLKNKSADSVRGIIPSGQNPYKMWQINRGILKPLLKIPGNSEPFNSPRQKLPKTYWQTGHIDVIRRETLIKGSMTGKRILPFIIDPSYAVDLDNESDWDYAEWIIKSRKLAIVKPRKF